MRFHCQDEFASLIGLGCDKKELLGLKSRSSMRMLSTDDDYHYEIKFPFAKILFGSAAILMAFIILIPPSDIVA